MLIKPDCFPFIIMIIFIIFVIINFGQTGVVPLVLSLLPAALPPSLLSDGVTELWWKCADNDDDTDDHKDEDHRCFQRGSLSSGGDHCHDEDEDEDDYCDEEQPVYFSLFVVIMMTMKMKMKMMIVMKSNLSASHSWSPSVAAVLSPLRNSLLLVHLDHDDD